MGGFLVLQLAGVLYLCIGILMTKHALPAFQMLIRDIRFVTSLGYSFTLAFGVTIAVLIASLLVASLLYSLGKRGAWIVFLHQIPLALPYVVAALGVYVLLANSGMIARVAYALGVISDSSEFPRLVNHPSGVGIFLGFFWKQLPFMSLVMLAVLRTTGHQYLEVARTLGSSPLRSFWHVQIPLLLPGVFPASCILFAYNISSFELPYLLGGTHPTTLSVLAYRFFIDTDAFVRTQAQIIAAVSICMAAIGFGLLFLLFRLLYQRVRW